MILSTTTISNKFEVLDLIFVLHSEKAGGFLGSGGVDTEKGINKAKAAIAEKARSLGADAVIGCDFEIRAATTGGINDKLVLEIFCFGTAVKIID